LSKLIEKQFIAYTAFALNSDSKYSPYLLGEKLLELALA
jgi:hypothetical protein